MYCAIHLKRRRKSRIFFQFDADPKLVRHDYVKVKIVKKGYVGNRCRLELVERDSHTCLNILNNKTGSYNEPSVTALPETDTCEAHVDATTT